MVIHMTEQRNNLGNEKKITLNIITPRGVKFVEQADRIIMRCIDGDLGVLYGHAPVTTALGDGILRFYNDGIETKLAVFGGIAEIGPTTVNILSTIAQRPEEIDLERAETDRQEAEAMLLEESGEMQIQNSNIMLRRCLVRIEVNLHLKENGYAEDNYDDE